MRGQNMIQLPYSEELNIGYLSRLFGDTSNCYKFFWFQAILSKLSSEHTRFTFDELINEMIADAWYMVTEYHLHLGPCSVTDNLEEAVKYIGTVKQFPAAEKRDVIISYLENNDDKKLLAYKTRYGLSVRETDVLAHILKNLSINEIAEELFISPNTVKFHVANLLKKTGAGSQRRLKQIVNEYDRFLDEKQINRL